MSWGISTYAGQAPARLVGRASLLLLLAAAFFLYAPAAGNAAITSFCGPGTGNGTCDQPGSVAVDSSGNVYVLDTRRGTLQEFSNTGEYLAGFAGSEPPPPPPPGVPVDPEPWAPLPFNGDGGVAVDNSGVVYVADPEHQEVTKFTVDPAHHTFTYGGVVETGDTFLAVAAAGPYIYTLDQAGQVGQWTPGTATACATADAGDTSIPGQSIHGEIAAFEATTTSESQRGITSSSDQSTIYVSDPASRSVLTYSSQIPNSTCPGSARLSSTLSGFTGYPVGVAESPDGLYVGDDNPGGTSHIRRYPDGTDEAGSVPVPGAAGDLAVDTSGTVFDAQRSSGSSVVRIQGPVAMMTSTPNTTLTSQTATFDGSQSKSLYGALNYSWSADGSTGTGPTFSHDFTAPGTYPVSLTVTDSRGSDTTTLNYTVAKSSAVFTNPGSTLTGQAATFDASQSAISNSTITDYAWDFDGSSSYNVDGGTSGTMTHVFSAPGTYPVQLRVTRSGGVRDTASGYIVVTPAPPPGPVGVSINNGDYATNTPSVELHLVWPAGASHALISNDGGFGPGGNTESVAVSPTIPWTLQSRTGQLLPKTVYVRFPDSSQPNQTFTDDIVLDTSTPVINAASLVGKAARGAGASIARVRSYRVQVRAKERISGISAAELSRRPRHTPPLIRYAGDRARAFAASAASDDAVVIFASRTQRGIVNLNQVISVSVTSQPEYVRVRSAAGNWSAWHRIK